MRVNSDFKELFAALNEAEVKYLLVGGYAVGWYAEPRFTKDLDVWVGSSGDNPERVLAALKRFGAPLDDLTVEDLATEGTVFQMGLPPNRIDILTEVSGGVDFETAWASRAQGRFDGVPFNVIGLTELIQNKEAVGRPQDVRDAKLLRRVLQRKK
jgi:hypothetical protein